MPLGLWTPPFPFSSRSNQAGRNLFYTCFIFTADLRISPYTAAHFSPKNGSTPAQSSNEGSPSMPEHPHHIRSEAYKYRFDLLFASLLCTIVVNIFFPEVLAPSGGVANQGDALLLPLRERVRERSFGSRYAVSHTRIELCTLGYRAGVIGAAMLARE